MNNLLSFWLAPVTALFQSRVYQEAARSRAGRGLLYSLYLAGLSVALIMAIFSAKIIPQVDAVADWMKTNMPVLIWTPTGMSLENGQTTATLVHPRYGTIALFDMTKTVVTEADLGKAYIMVTAKKVFFKRGPGQIEERDVTGAMAPPGQQLPSKVRVTGEIAMKIYQNVKGAMMFMAPIVLFVLSCIFFLVMNLFYSLVGLLFNLMRKEKLGYGAIFNLACFATTAAFTLTWLKILIPVGGLNLPFAVSILINLAYLFMAFKVTDKKSAA